MVFYLENYGLSETLFISSENLISKNNYNTKTTGFLIDKVKLKFGNYNKKFSNILVKTPSFEGYMGEDGIINKNLETDGYFNTGDVGYKKNGKLIIVGREKDIIKKGGFLVNLIEIELVTSKIKGVFEAAAVKVDDDFYGETSVVFFTTQKN